MQLESVRRSIAAFAAIAAVAATLAPAAARAEIDVYRFSGTVSDNDADVLFPGKSVGETYHGRFKLDTDATLVGFSDAGQLGSWSGDFSVTVAGNTYPASLLVWSGGPAGLDDGFELSFAAGPATGFLLLRSSKDLYTVPEVPTAVALADMDTAAEVAATVVYPFPESDQGTIAQLPEPSGPSAALAVFVALAATGSVRLTRVV